MQTQPAEQKEHHDARPKDPLILPRPPLDHANGIAGHAQGVGDRVQPLLRALQHLPLRAQVTQHRLAARNVLVERVVRARKEILLPHRVLLARDIAAAHSPVAGCGCCCRCRCRRAEQPPTRARVLRVVVSTIRRGGARRSSTRGSIGVGVFRGGGHVGPAAEEFVAVLAVQDLVAGGLEGVELAAVAGELGAEVSDALVGFVLLGGVELLLRERVVLVDGLLEGGERDGEGAERGGAEGGGGGRRGVGRVWRGGGREGLGGELGEVFADRGALFQSTVEGCVLVGGGCC